MHQDSSEFRPALRAERSGAVLHVTFDRPQRANALDAQSVDRFIALLDDPEMTRDLRTLIVAGSGDNFCGGFDLSLLATHDEAALVVRFLRIETLLQRIYHAPFVTLALAHGNAIGAGADLFAACSYRIAEPETRFRFPGWRFGIALGTRRLCDRIGAGPAQKLLMENRTLAAAEAAACGLATQVAPKDEWRAIAEATAAHAQRLPFSALTRLNRLCVPDHREADMAALVTSVLEPPGIKGRMLAYVAEPRGEKNIG